MSPNGAWNILHMIRNSNKMNNKHPQPARAFYDALNENTEPHRRLIKATSGDASGRCPIMLRLMNGHGVIWGTAASLSWARCYLGDRLPPPSSPCWSGGGWECLHIHRQPKHPGRPPPQLCCPVPKEEEGQVKFTFSLTFPFHRKYLIFYMKVLIIP